MWCIIVAEMNNENSLHNRNLPAFKHPEKYISFRHLCIQGPKVLRYELANYGELL
jgi:hypothetical protein